MQKEDLFLIIDLDGTLVDTKEDIAYSLNETLSRGGFKPVPLELIEKHVATGISPLIREQVPESQFEKLWKNFAEIYLQNIARKSRPYPGWDELLAQFDKKQKVILTNKPQKFADALINELSLTENFAAVYGREAFAERKPSPLPILEILKTHGIKAPNAVMIGDSFADVESARGAKVCSCGANFGYGSEGELRDSAPDFVIDSPAEFLTAYQQFHEK